jgi:hypothetical protein
VTAIIIANIPKDAFKYIKSLNNGFNIMEKLKEIYKGNKSTDIQFIVERLYPLKIKNCS